MVITAAHGYHLGIDLDQVDAVRFLRLTQTKQDNADTSRRAALAEAVLGLALTLIGGWSYAMSVPAGVPAARAATVGGVRENHESAFEAIKAVASRPRIAPESLRRWQRRAEVYAGQRSGTANAENAEIKGF